MSALQRARFVAVTAIVIAIDLLTKVWAQAALADENVELGFITFRLVYNTGVAFSLGNELPVAVVSGVTGLLMAGFAVAGWRGHLGGGAIAGLLVGGGLGNLIDRVIRGAVVDMIDVGPWPVFNVADIALTSGIVLLVFASSFADDEDDEVDDADDREVAGVTV